VSASVIAIDKNSNRLSGPMFRVGEIQAAVWASAPGRHIEHLFEPSVPFLDFYSGERKVLLTDTDKEKRP